MNYYSIHKNKKPKKLFKRKKGYVSMITPFSALTVAMGLSQVALIQSQAMPKYNLVGEQLTSIHDKIFKIAETTINTANSIAEYAKKEPRRRFLATGRYTK